MGRTAGATTTKTCWKMNAFNIDNENILTGEYTNLRDVAKALGISYYSVCELTPNGRNVNKTIGRGKFEIKINLIKV